MHPVSRENQRRRIALSVVVPPRRNKKTLWKRFLITFTGIGTICGAILGGIQIYDRFASRPPNVIVQGFFGYTPVLESHLRSDPPKLEWEVAISVTNLESKSIAIVGVDPQFAPLKIEGVELQINLKGGSLADAERFESEAKLYERTVQHDDWEVAHAHNPYTPNPQPPYLVKSGETQYFLFHLFLAVYRDGEICRVNECAFNDELGTPTLLLGGHIDHSGRVWCIPKDVTFTFRFDDGRVLQRNLRSFVGVVGCIGPILEPPKTPGGEPSIMPIPE
jgi:hypothetical protein